MIKNCKQLRILILILIAPVLYGCDSEAQRDSTVVVKMERKSEIHPEVVIEKKDPQPDLTEELVKKEPTQVEVTTAEEILTEKTIPVLNPQPQVTFGESDASVTGDTLPLSALKNTTSFTTNKLTATDKELAVRMKAILASQKGRKRPLRVVYFNPSDRQPVPRFKERLEKILTEFRDFYGKGMEHHGFGFSTFDLEKEGGRLKIHMVQSKTPKSKFSRSNATARQIKNEVAAVLKKSGIDVEKETVIVFQNLADLTADNKFFDNKAPYYGAWNTNVGRKGFCYTVDSKLLDWELLKEKGKTVLMNGDKKLSLGAAASAQIGGSCHELGHALCLNHTHGNRAQNQQFGTALMGYGNWTFGQQFRQEGKGSYLSFASAVKLVGHPCFSPVSNTDKWDLSFTALSLQIGDRKLEIHGKADSDPGIYSLIAFCDDKRNNSDYDATGWVGAVDKTGAFNLVIGDLKANTNYKLNMHFLHGNGRQSARSFDFHTDRSGKPVLNYNTREKLLLKSLMQAKISGKTDVVKKNLSSLKNCTDETVNFLKETIAVMDSPLHQSPEQIQATTSSIYLSETKWSRAVTGYQKARVNRVQEDNYNAPWPFLMSSKSIHRYGLYGHAHSEYVYKTGGKWKTLEGSCSLRRFTKGSVEFKILGDGKELFNSGVLTNSSEKPFSVNLKGINEIKLIVTDGGNGKNSDWGQWLSPKLTR